MEEKRKEKKRKEVVEERRERKKEREVRVFYIRERGKKERGRRHICYEMRDSSLFIGAFYRRLIRY
jgi:hypothetical protein